MKTYPVILLVIAVWLTVTIVSLTVFGGNPTPNPSPQGGGESASC